MGKPDSTLLQSLVQSDHSGFYVYNVDAGKVSKIPFQAGFVTAGGLVQVISGIKPGTKIIGSGISMLSLGQKVKVRQ